MARIALIGCGLIGQKRAKNLTSECQLLACVDTQLEKAEHLAKQFPAAHAFTNYHDVIHRADIDIVIIATIHSHLAEITLAAIHAGKHVLVEKPAARNAKELEPIKEALKKSNTLLRVGFNHRYHRAFQKARELIDQNELGELMFLRARYGHGGRIGYDTEWRANPQLSGGGELIDQGIHLIDLARWFLGEFQTVEGCAQTYYWNMPVDDNSFLLLTTSKKQVAFLHASCTEWKNNFSFEIYGKKGKLDINGLGGSYGTERITFYKMLPQMGPPETITWEYPMTDNSWEIEFLEFIEDIKLHRKPAANIDDAYAALKIVEEIYDRRA